MYLVHKCSLDTFHCIKFHHLHARGRCPQTPTRGRAPLTPLGKGRQSLAVTDNVLAHLQTHKQKYICNYQNTPVSNWHNNKHNNNTLQSVPMPKLEASVH